MALARYRLGCPFWSFKPWNGSLYSADARPEDRLRQYASVFNSVEGNTSFWSVPSPRSVSRWREAAPPDFRFCFKVPREITHERMLLDARAPLAAFLRAVEPLGERLGSFLLQLPPGLGPRELPQLEAFLDLLPQELPFAVELRHRAFFEDDALAGHCDELLAEHGCDRVMMDTRALRAGNPRHPEVLAAIMPGAVAEVLDLASEEREEQRLRSTMQECRANYSIESRQDLETQRLEVGLALLARDHARDAMPLLIDQ